MWMHRKNFTLIELLVVFLIAIAGTCAGAPSGKRKTGVHNVRAFGPLIQKEDLEYVGAFRVPKGELGNPSTHYDRLGYGGSALAFNKSRNSLFIVGHPYGKRLVEISIPKVVNSNNLDDLKTASVMQPDIDITEGNWNNLKKDGTAVDNGGLPGGFLVYNGRLIGSAYAYYDGAYEAYRSHFTASLNWKRTGAEFRGMYIVGISDRANGGFVGGYMCLIPPEWRKALGGPALTGIGGMPIIARSSLGPCAWVFNPDHLGVKDPAPATMLVGYPINHPTLGTWIGTSLYYNMSTEVRGIVFPYGTSSVLFFGRHGLGKTGKGDTCYGIGTTDRSLDGKEVPGTNGQDHYCYDPTDGSKGTHGYPYVYRVWAYDANDLLKVKKGETNPATGKPYQPWDIKPYAIWNMHFPFSKENAQILGAAYDPATQRIYLSQAPGEIYDTEPYPIIQVYRIKIPARDRSGYLSPKNRGVRGRGGCGASAFWSCDASRGEGGERRAACCTPAAESSALCRRAMTHGLWADAPGPLFPTGFTTRRDLQLSACDVS